MVLPIVNSNEKLEHLLASFPEPRESDLANGAGSPGQLRKLPTGSERYRKLLQFSVFGFGLLQDGDVRVGVFPECEKILVRRAGLGAIALQRVSTP